MKLILYLFILFTFIFISSVFSVDETDGINVMQKQRFNGHSGGYGGHNGGYGSHGGGYGGYGGGYGHGGYGGKFILTK